MNLSKPYDYLIVGSGLFGSVFAFKAHQKGKKCLIIDKRNHLGGNVYCENNEGLITHKYGAHIFHTNDEKIWNFVNQFTTFLPYIHQVKVNINQQIYSFPFNINTLKQWYKENDEKKVLEIFNSRKITKHRYENLEELALSEVGKDLYENFIKGYTEKQWNKACKDLPMSILKRIPVRTNDNENYFEDKFQGMPVNGYNELVNNLTKGIEIKLNIDFFTNKNFWESQAEKIIFTGCIDELFEYEFGKLDYRSLKFENEWKNQEKFQAVAVVNYPEKDYEFTRIIEHKHFHPVDINKTLITKEIPQEFNKYNEPFYPVVDSANIEKYRKYKEKAETQNNYILGGRLAEFKYYDMHQVIASALKKAENEL